MRLVLALSIVAVIAIAFWFLASGEDSPRAAAKRAATLQDPAGPLLHGTGRHLETEEPPASSVDRPAAILGCVTDAWDGAPIAGVLIASHGAEARTNALGRFLFLAEAGATTLELSAPGYESRLVSLPRSERREGRFDAGTLTLTGVSPLTLRVVDAKGQPAAGARCWPLDAAPLNRQLGSNRLSILPPLSTPPDDALRCDAQGQVTLGRFSPTRTLSAGVQADGMAPTCHGPFRADGSVHEVVLAVAWHLRAVAPTGLDVLHTPLSLDIQPLTGPAHERFRRIVPFEGEVVSALLPGGRYRVHLRAAGLIHHTEEVELDQDRLISLPALKLTALPLRVRWEDGAPVERFHYHVLSGHAMDDPAAAIFWLYRAGVRDGTDGEVTAFSKLPAPGARFHVLVGASGALPAAVGATARAERTQKELVVTLRRAGTLNGTVEGIAPGARLELVLQSHEKSGSRWTSDGPVVDACTVAPDGSYELCGAGAGRYLLRAEFGMVMQTVQDVDLPETGTTRLDVSVSSGSLVVVPTNSGEAPDALVRVEERGGVQTPGPLLRGTRLDDGVHFRGLLAGSYRLGWASDLAQWQLLDGHGSERTVAVELRAGKRITVPWELRGPPVVVRTRIKTPRDLNVHQLVAGIVPLDGLERAPTAIRWRAVPTGGDVALEVSAGEPFLFVVGAITSFRGDPSGGLMPLLIRGFGKASEVGEVLEVPPPGRILVDVRDPRVQLVACMPEAFRGVLRWAYQVTKSASLGPLAPGMYIVWATGRDPKTYDSLGRTWEGVTVSAAAASSLEALFLSEPAKSARD